MDKHVSIAIDGPSGAGKSTIARAAADKYNYFYVDTGALYRSVGLGIIRKGLDYNDVPSVIAYLPEIHVDMKYDESGKQRMILNGEDVTDEIRLPEVSQAASKVSAIPEVRQYLLEMQRNMAELHDVIMDGRDIGTVVLPNADVKIFLTATLEDRARRRYEEYVIKGVDTTYEQVLADMKKRDEQDSSRAAAPLKPAEDSVFVDTTGNTFEESVALICETIEKVIGEKK